MLGFLEKHFLGSSCKLRVLWFAAAGMWLVSVPLSVPLLADSRLPDGWPSSWPTTWMEQQAEVSHEKLFKNISAPGTAKGSVIASPSNASPNYFFHWVRDAGLVMDTVVNFYRRNYHNNKTFYYETLVDFIRFSRKNQQSFSLSGLGEPKFNVDGSAFDGPWGRPQNDGPAIRASSLIKLGMFWLSEGQESLVREFLYTNELPATKVVKTDLEYVSHHWRESNFDLWEEISGKHFYTLMVQRKAMILGAKFAQVLGDYAASDWYSAQAREMEQEIHRFWNGQQIVATLDRTGGIDYKSSGLDTAVILGVLHGSTGDGFYSYSDERVLRTFQLLEEAFYRLYPVNHKGYAAVAIGRYPEDHYDGNGFSEGNPWVLATLAFGELLHSAASELERKGALEVTPVNARFFEILGIQVSPPLQLSAGDDLFRTIVTQMRVKGDDFISRAVFHGYPGGSLSEQINRHSGFMQGAYDLTWNYAAFITAYLSRASYRSVPEPLRMVLVVPSARSAFGRVTFMPGW